MRIGRLLISCVVLSCGDPAKDPNQRKVPPHRSFGSGTIAHVPPVPDVAMDAGDGPRHVIIVSIDTLRADYLGCYGSDWVKTPNIDALCARSVVFDHHISAAPTTLASHTSLLTGLWPHRHGVSRNGFKLSLHNTLLAEVLADAGFVTAAVIAAFPLDPRFHMDQGFHLYEADLDQAFVRGENQQAQRSGDRVTDAALSFAATRDPDKERIFMFVHYFDVHAPYDAPDAWKDLYPAPSADAPTTDGSLPDIKKARKQLEDDGSSPLSEPLRRAYAAGVSYADHEVGRLLDGLGPMLDDTLLIVTSDHGEAMDEGTEYWNHGYTVTDAVVRTPLIVQMPGLTPRRTNTLASNVDVFPTVLEELGVDSPRVQGKSLSTALRTEGEVVRDYAFAEATKPYSAETDGLRWRNERKCRAARTTEFKRLRCPYDETREFYALPDENTDVADQHKSTVRAFDAAILNWEANRRPMSAAYDKTPSVQTMLKELGYLEE